MLRKLALLLVFGASQAFGFIYPVSSMIEAAFKGRDPEKAIEVVIRHRIGGRSMRAMLRENFYVGENRVFVSWGIEGKSGSTVRAIVTPSEYNLMGQRTYRRESRVVLSYLVGKLPEALEKSLLDEKFVRRDQLLAFKPEYQPSGSPKSWKPNASYIKHDDVFLQRLDRGGVAIAVLGSDEGLDKRTVYFDRSLRGLSRIEWKEEGRSTAWNFEHFKKFPVGAYYPKRLSLTRGGVEIISSELITARYMSDKAWAAIKKRYSPPKQSISMSSSVEDALQVLLRYR